MNPINGRNPHPGQPLASGVRINEPVERVDDVVVTRGTDRFEEVAAFAPKKPKEGGVSPSSRPAPSQPSKSKEEVKEKETEEGRGGERTKRSTTRVGARSRAEGGATVWPCSRRG